MGKRAKTEGTIYYSKTRGKWVAQLPAGPDGRRPVRTAATEGEALALLREMHAERAQGREVGRKAETVEDLLTFYLDNLSSTVRSSTMLSYRRQVDNIIDKIGRVKIDALVLEGVQKLATALTRDHGPVAMRHALQRLKAAYELITPERVARNPVDLRRLKLRRVEQVERRPLDDAQVRAMLAAGDDAELMGHYSRYGPALWLMALLGLRRGEVCGASWRDLNWEKAELQVRQQFAPSLEGGFTLGPVKTAAGARVLPLGPRLLARLRAHWEMQQEERKARGAAWKEHGFILAREHGEPVHPQAFGAMLRRLCHLTKLPHVHPHLLRHGCATMISEEGYSEAVIAGILGHGKGPSVTRRYTHATEKAKRNALISLEVRLLGEVAEDARAAQ